MNINKFREQLSTLIATPSVSCSSPAHDMPNIAVINLLANWLDELGFVCEIQPIAGWPGKANLVAARGTGPGGLVFAGHTDTVPCDPDRWEQDPFRLLERDNRFYGLGAADMKGFFPVALAALERFKDVDLKHPVLLLATADEESSMCGARALAELSSLKPRYAVIGEPTGMRPVRMHKGIVMESIRVEGQAGHSSNPDLGKNALEVMHQVIGELLSYRHTLQSRYRNDGFDVALPTLNLGCIHGGDNPNRICGRCELHFDLRLLPGMDLHQLRSEISQRLQPIAERSGTDIVFSSLFPGIAPYEQAADSALVKAAESLTGHPSQSVAYATEAPFLQALGAETIVLGPGEIEQAHQPGEFIDFRQIPPAVDTLASLIKTFCL